MAGTLTMFGTPIGNAGDLSPRAVAQLGRMDILYCEDTRVTQRLLSSVGVSVPLQSLHDDSPASHWSRAIKRALDGQNIGFASDAGMPGISDPGRKLVREAWHAGIRVTVVPGPSSVGSLLACSPFVNNTFAFLGFAPRSDGALAEFAAIINSSDSPVYFFDSPKRFKKTINLLHAVLEPHREIIIGREMTKQHEQIVLFSADQWPQISGEIPELGEFTVGVSASTATAGKGDEELQQMVSRLAQAGFSPKDTVTCLSITTKTPANRLKSLVYGK